MSAPTDIQIWFEDPATNVQRVSIPPGQRVLLVWSVAPDEADDWDWVAHCQVCGQRAVLLTVQEVWTDQGMVESVSHYECDEMHLSQFKTMGEDIARSR